MTTGVVIDVESTHEGTLAHWVVRWADDGGEHVRTFSDRRSARSFARSLRGDDG